MSHLGLGRALRPLPPPPDLVSDLNLRPEDGSDVQSCIDFLDCLLTEMPGGRAGERTGRTGDHKDSLAGVDLPLRQQRETLLC